MHVDLDQRGDPPSLPPQPLTTKCRTARLGLMGGALAASWLLTWDSVAAQSPSEAEKLERLERQSQLLQQQLNRQNEQLNRQNDLIRELQQQVSRAKKKSEKKEIELAKRSE